MLLAATTIVITACSDSSTGADVPESEIDVKTIENLSAVGDNGEFTFFKSPQRTRCSAQRFGIRKLGPGLPGYH